MLCNSAMICLPLTLYPLCRAGCMVLNRNRTNWFTEIEQAAFSPSNMVPGTEPSPRCCTVQARRQLSVSANYQFLPTISFCQLSVSASYQFLPTNAPKAPVYCPIERDRFMNFTKNYGTDPNYIATQLKPVKFLDVMGKDRNTTQ